MAGAGYSFRLVRTKADALDDPSPLVTAPASDSLLYLFTERPDADSPTIGFHAFLHFTTPAANTADVEVWARNETDNTWILVSAMALTGVSHRIGFEQDDLDDPVLFIRLINVTGGNPIQVWAEEA